MTDVIFCDHCGKPMQPAFMVNTDIPMEVFTHFGCFYFECPDMCGKAWYIPPVNGSKELLVKRVYAATEGNTRKSDTSSFWGSVAKGVVSGLVSIVTPQPHTHPQYEEREVREWCRDAKTGQPRDVWVKRYKRKS